MADIDRKPSANSVHNVHTHHCPECRRAYSCNCQQNYTKDKLVCRDCETGNYIEQEKESA
jgi:hypothetical protein